MFCCTFLYVHYSFAIILMGKRELVALLSLSSWCLVMVVWIFLAKPWVRLLFVIVVFLDHTHLLFILSNILPLHTPLIPGWGQKVNFHFVLKVVILLIK